MTAQTAAPSHSNLELAISPLGVTNGLRPALSALTALFSRRRRLADDNLSTLSAYELADIGLTRGAFPRMRDLNLATDQSISLRADLFRF